MRNAFFKDWLGLLGVICSVCFLGNGLQGRTPAGFSDREDAGICLANKDAGKGDTAVLFMFVKTADEDGFTVYFKKPSGWGSSTKIYYWNRQPGGTSNTWPGENMTLCANGWYYFTFPSTTSTNLIFNDGTNQTVDLSRSMDGWYDNGVWYSTGSCTPPNVTVSPPIPTPDEPVTITFDATGSALAGLPKVYFHSGVSATLGASTNFDYSKGNWGQDDGVGEMTNTGGNIWQIVLPSLRSYFNVPSTADVFGLNFLFRSADGAAKEDYSGANYFNPVNTGNYFTVTNPASSPHLALIGTPFSLTSTANTAPQNWTLEEVDANDVVISQIATQTGGASFTHPITLSDTSLRRFKVNAAFPGETKVKFFEAQGYGPLCTTARPAWTRPGINYHAGDPTKVTLVLHAPTYTRFKKGTGFESGTNPTTPKNVVHVIGSFNNWAINESYKLCRDTDGWNGTTDSDGDGDRGDYWWIELSGLTPGQEYVFQYLIDGNLQVADPYAEKISDPDDGYISSTTYPSLIAYPSSYTGGHRASVLQTGQSAYTWTAPAFSPPSTNNLNIYELHFRDFTEEGTYLAAIDKLDYLKALGINAIHVMPVSEFEGNSSWGYNPNFYFAPDKAYGTKNDLKKFINECHKRQIQVFNDLVLNHAFYSNVMARMYWNTAQNKPANDNPWFNPDHKAVADPAGWWGVDWNHESEHTQNMVDSILNFWLQEYNFDGFRFDFTKGFTQTAQDGGDPWASSYDQDRIDLLKRMVNEMWTNNPGSVAIFEHLAENAEDKVLADFGILMWSGVGHHNAVKNFMLGWNADNPDIYTSGIYNASGRNFNFANWMSYMESHDEERQAVEVITYGKNISTETDAALKLSKTVDRLKLGASFNLLFPGPRMVWQFEELAYDISINFNGRTGEKPVHWEYFDDPTRRELFRQMSTLLYLRNTYPLYATTPNYDNIGWGANAITTPRRMALNDGNGHYVIVIGNLDPDAGHDAYPSYNATGTWYRYNGDPAVDGTSFTVSNAGSAYFLQPSEVLVLTNFPVNNPVLDATMVKASARTLLSGPFEPNTGLMRDDLRSLGYIPTSEPYTALGYVYTGGAGGETINPSVLAVTGEDAIVDWVVLELRSEATPGTVTKSRPAMLQRDGDIVDLDGTTTAIAFSGVTPGEYFVTVRHRNHLGIASASAVYLSPVACALDFARGASATYGSNAQQDLGSGKMGFWPGDGNGNGQIQNTDVEEVWKGQVGLSGYLKGDFNLNGQVQNTDLESYWKISVGKGTQMPQN
ncbi:MAG: 1,4-alpha-glucan branching enzyme GlgB [Haliscomenobacter sp.]|nr:1,4-alpha-glucan branching enzyme GlgB [Haliscomenobacter sp.]